MSCTLQQIFFILASKFKVVIIILEKKIEIDANFGAKIQSYHFLFQAPKSKLSLVLERKFKFLNEFWTQH